MRILSPVECRVLGVLVEKERTVPDTYPLSLNALLAGCNQKTSREPVMNLRDAEVQEALDALRASSLVIESSGAKVMRYGHNAERALGLPALSVVLLAVLMLRGAQTAAELRINAERMHRFADTSSVEGFLDEMAGRASTAGGPAVRLLPRRPGEREARWVHLLAGEPPEAAAAPAAMMAEAPSSAGSELTDLRARVAALEERLTRLEQVIAPSSDHPSG